MCPAATPAPPTVPLAPSNVTISVPTATSPVTVNWKDNSINETGFNIYDGTTKKGTVTANKVTFTDTAVCPSQNGKRYSVEAYNGSGTSTRVSAAAVVCPSAPAPTVPNSPTNVKATPSNPTVSAVTISWTNPAGIVQGSYVYEKTNGGAAVLVAQLTAAITSFVDSSPGCPAGGTIQYQVQVYNSSGNSAKASSNTITCPGPAVQPAPDATSGSLKPASGSVGNVTVNSLLPKIITVDGSVILAPVGGQSSVAYIETQTTVLQPIPAPTQVEQTPVQNNDNYAIPLVWPGFTPPVTQVRVDYALIGASGSVLYSNSVIYTQIGSGPGYTPTVPVEPGPMPPGLNTIKQIGQFKTIPTASNNFNDIKNLELNKDYWVRLTIAGDSAPPTFSAFGPSDIMLVLDITGSMDSKFYTDSSHSSSVTKLQGAKAALSTFVDNADPKDYLGFGTFRICRNLYDKTKAPLIWTYEGMSSFYRKTTGFSALHMPLQSLASNTAAVKSQFKNTIGGITYDFCLKSSGTDIGAGITLGTTQLTDILDDPKSLRPDGTPYKVSSVGTYTKNASRGGTVPKYIVIATDGQENSSPRFREPDMDGSTDTVQSAKKRGVKIYTLAIGHDADSYGADMQFIATATGGKYYPGRTQQELSNAYLGILQNIQGSGTSGKIVVNEKINNTNFDTVVPSKGFPSSNFDFKLTKFDSTTGGETDVTATACDKLSCISGSSTDGMNITLPYFTDKERYYIYFKAHAKQVGANVDVDSPTSQVVYPSGVKVLANTKVNINGLDAYFIAEGGDVYSHSSSFTPIKSELPLNTFFVTEDEPVVFYTGPQTAHNNNSANLDLGEGQLSPTNREIKGYTVTSGMSYNSLFEKVKGAVQKVRITNSNIFAPTAGEVGYYMTDSADGDLTIGGPGWDRGPIKEKNIVVFVPGDLYINDSNNGKPFSIASDGRSVVSFVVRGRIGIDPSVTSLQGIYVADGIIDTACNVGIGADGLCSPDLKDAPLGSSLTIEGMMYSLNGGFNLHRQGTPGIAPGEKFIFRPDFFMNAIVALGHNESTFRECILINCSR